MRRGGFEIRRVPVSRLGDDEVEQLWRIYNRFVDARRDAFVRTLATADDAFLFRRRPGGALVGFEALRVLAIDLDHRRHTVVCAYYADLSAAARGQNLLQRVALCEYLRLRLRHPFRPMFWMFTASTYLSYLLLPRNVVRYWPRPDEPTPGRVRALMNAVMTALHRAEWDAGSGVLRRHGALRYREGLAGGDGAPVAEPHIGFYAARNPGQGEGDSLVCVCPMSIANAVAVAAGMLRRWWQRASAGGASRDCAPGADREGG